MSYVDVEYGSGGSAKYDEFVDILLNTPFTYVSSSSPTVTLTTEAVIGKKYLMIVTYGLQGGNPASWSGAEVLETIPFQHSESSYFWGCARSLIKATATTIIYTHGVSKDRGGIGFILLPVD